MLKIWIAYQQMRGLPSKNLRKALATKHWPERLILA